jgi:ribA/ribD-fused uncharacterized protein
MSTASDGKFGTGIYGFFGDFRWLSNFELCETIYEGDIYPSVENAYQAAKTNDREARRPMMVKQSNDEMIEGKRARLFGKKAALRPDWEEVKVDIMHSIVREKFYRNPVLKDALLMTNDLYLEETNYWRDQFWGVCKGIGENNLGIILMNIRKELKDVMNKEKE